MSTEEVGKGLQFLPQTTPGKRMVVVLLSGDGGGTGGLTKAMAEGLNAQGYGVLWFDCFTRWGKLGPPGDAGTVPPDAMLEDIRAELGKVAKADAWVMVVGYSFGADVVPWVVEFIGQTGLKVQRAVMVEPGENAAFRPSMVGWLNIEYGTYPVVPKLLQTQVPTLVLYASDGLRSLLGRLSGGYMRKDGRRKSPGRDPRVQRADKGMVATRYLGGDHTFDGRYENVVVETATWLGE